MHRLTNNPYLQMIFDIDVFEVYDAAGSKELAFKLV
jgi:hypothetical protein